MILSIYKCFTAKDGAQMLIALMRWSLW